MSKLEKLARRFKKKIESADKAALAAIINEYARVIAKLLARLESLKSSGASDEAIAAAASYAAQAQAEFEVLHGRICPIIEKGQKLGVTIGREQAGALLESVGFTAGSMNRLNEGAFEVIVGMTQEGSPLREVLDKGAGYSIKEEVMNILKDSVLQGKSPSEAAAEMVKVGYNDRKHALLVCRTETMRAYRISTKETYEANGVERVIWAASESSATCAACWAMDGRAFDLNKLPNDHPNGRCTIVPVIDDEDEETWDSEERFKERLTEDEQKKILGPTRWQLWKEGKLKWEDIPAVKPNDTYGPTLGISPLKDGKAPELSEDVSGSGNVRILRGPENGGRYETLNRYAGEQQKNDESHKLEKEIEAFREKIKEGIYSTEIKEGQQKKHYRDPKNNEYKNELKRRQKIGWGEQSILTISMEEVHEIAEDFANGGSKYIEKILAIKGNNVDVLLKKKIGFVPYGPENEYKTSTGCLHFGKEGCHLVPVDDRIRYKQ